MQIDERVKEAMVEFSRAQQAEREARHAKVLSAEKVRQMTDHSDMAESMSDHLGIDITARAVAYLALSGRIHEMGAIETEVKALRCLFGSMMDIRMTAPHESRDEYHVQLDVSTVDPSMLAAAQDALRAMDLFLPVVVNP